MLVNNAGQNLPGGRSEYEPDVFEETVSVNLFGSVPHGSGDARPPGGERRSTAAPSVVNSASMASFFGIEMVPGYGAAKAGDRAAHQDPRGRLGEARASA